LFANWETLNQPPRGVSLSAQAMHRGADIAMPLTVVGVLTSVAGTFAFGCAMRRAFR
jgi:hypothetical protein